MPLATKPEQLNVRTFRFFKLSVLVRDNRVPEKQLWVVWEECAALPHKSCLPPQTV